MNTVFNLVGRVLFGLLSWAGPALQVLVLAVLVAAGSLLVFKWTSNQEKIRASKGPLKARILGVLLFRHDLRVLFRSLMAALGRSLANLRFLAIPMAVMIVPLVLLFVQFEMRLGSRGLLPGETTVLRVHVADDSALDAVTVDVPEGVRLETPGVRVRDPETGLLEVDFRLRATEEGEHIVRIAAGGEPIEKSLTVRPGPGLVSHRRADGGDLLDRLLYPVEDAVPGGGPIRAVDVAYRGVTVPFLGIDWAWWLLFLVFMVLALFLLRGPMGIDF